MSTLDTLTDEDLTKYTVKVSHNDDDRILSPLVAILCFCLRIAGSSSRNVCLSVRPSVIG